MSHGAFKSILCVAAGLTVAGIASTLHASGGPVHRPSVYVISQGLYYDAAIGPDLPRQGTFQQLVPGGPTGLMTRYGPGDAEYTGGRWWVDVNSNGIDAYVLSPLIPPGRTRP
jgi:hypothetical protein